MVNVYPSKLPIWGQKTVEVGNVVAFLASPLASAITSVFIYVDNGLNQWVLELIAPYLKILIFQTMSHSDNSSSYFATPSSKSKIEKCYNCF